MLSPIEKSKWFTDPKKRKYLIDKAALIDLFTISELPIVQSSNKISERNIGDIVDYSEYNYQKYTFINKDITTDNNIATITVYGQDYGLYELNKTYVFNNELEYKVISLTNYTSLEDHPNIDSLSDDDKLNIQKYNTYQIVVLLKSKKSLQYYGYDLFTDSKYIYGVDYESSEHPTRYIVLAKYGDPAFGIYEELNLYGNDIENYTSSQPIKTTYGRYLANYFALAYPFGSAISFINEETTIGDIEKIIAQKIRNNELTTEQGGKYLDSIFFIGSFGELCIPGLTEKALTTSPEVKKRKKELLAKYKDQLDDPIIETKIEDELIALDKEWLKHDPSMGFYGDAGKKFNVQRKKQYVIGGIIEDFSKEKGQYDFITNSLAEGWDIGSFATICNEIRKGSYNRGVETAKGGDESKKLMRIMQNIKITADDCGTKEYLTITLNENIINKFLGRWILDNNNNLILLNEKNKDQYLNKTVKMRSFMFCKQKDGFCNKCGGVYFETLTQDVIGVLALELTSTFLQLSMKNMHGTKIKTTSITSLSPFIV